ncbi:hypothetical protein J6590_061857 [Homalodisca vitripennis]|nr:hypothetical protein J6590_061857 [Homalodisca vitripennis]
MVQASARCPVCATAVPPLDMGGAPVIYWPVSNFTGFSPFVGLIEILVTTLCRPARDKNTRPDTYPRLSSLDGLAASFGLDDDELELLAAPHFRADLSSSRLVR